MELEHSTLDVVVELGDGGRFQEGRILSLRTASRDLACGAVAGSMSAIFKYPFDLAKVRLQSQLLSSAPGDASFKGPIDCLVRTYKQEGVQGLYRGLPAPIVGSMTEAATLFLTYSTLQNAIRKSNGLGESDPLSIPQHSLAAAGAGFVTSFVLTPIDLVKCKMQVQMMNTHLHVAPAYPLASTSTPTPTSASSSRQSLSSNATKLPFQLSATIGAKPSLKPSTSIPIRSVSGQPLLSAVHDFKPLGPVELIRSIVRTHGWRGMWVGHSGMMMLETIGAGSWFTVKESVAHLLRQRRARLNEGPLDHLGSGSGKVGRLRPWESAVSGAVAGATCILTLYPIDTVKSAMQTEEDVKRGARKSSSQPIRENVPRDSFVKVMKRIYGVHGFRGLYAGCGMTVARVVPSSGIVFVVYDQLSNWFRE